MAKTKMRQRLKSYVMFASKWIKANKLEFIILASILAIGGFMRLYKIDGYMTFLGDEGRDAIIVRRLLVNFDPILVGPGTSIGNMYLGPLYYYLIAPALFLFNFSPVGPSVLIALIGIATIFLIWYVSREWFSTIKVRQTKIPNLGALVASLLYAISPTVIIYSRSSWNPNIMPFFSLLAVYSIWRVWIYKSYKWLIVTSISLAFALQSHYLGLLLVLVLGLFWLMTAFEIQKKVSRIAFIKSSVVALLIFINLMSPLIIFDSRHGWLNYNSMKVFFTERQTTVSIKPWKALGTVLPLSEQVSTRLVGGYDENTGKYLTYLIGIFLAVLNLSLIRKVLSKNKNRKIETYEKAIFLLSVWLGSSLVGLGLYKQHIYDHYFGFIFATPFIALGGIVYVILGSHKLKKLSDSLKILLILGIVFFGIVKVNLENNPLKYSPNKQYERSVKVSQRIIEESGGDRFNFAVIAERNYEGAYQYYLERVGANFVMIDPQRADDTITDQLFVICEMPKDLCDPTHNGKAEIAGFGWTDIEKDWEVYGVTLFKLVHSKVTQ